MSHSNGQPSSTVTEEILVLCCSKHHTITMLSLDKCHESMWILREPRNQSQTQAETKFLYNKAQKHSIEKIKSMFWSFGFNTSPPQCSYYFLKVLSPWKASPQILYIVYKPMTFNHSCTLESFRELKKKYQWPGHTRRDSDFIALTQGLSNWSYLKAPLVILICSQVENHYFSTLFWDNNFSEVDKHAFCLLKNFY